MADNLNKDEVAIQKISREIASTARALLEDHPLNWYNDTTARADALRRLRAAIELAPTIGDV